MSPDNMEEERVVACVLVALILEEDEKRKGKTQMDKKKRTQKGLYTNIVKELRLEDTGAYKEMMRMNYDTFLTLLSFIEPYISPCLFTVLFVNNFFKLLCDKNRFSNAMTSNVGQHF